MRVEDYRTEAEIERHVRNQKAYLRRRRNHPGPALVYTCHGGPWDGDSIALRTGSTARLVIGEWRGRYVPERTVKPMTGSDTAVAWEAES